MDLDNFDTWYQKAHRALKKHNHVTYGVSTQPQAHLQPTKPQVDILDLAKRTQPYIDELRKRVHTLVAHPNRVTKVANRGKNRYTLLKMPKAKAKRDAAQYALKNVKSELQHICRQRFGDACFISYNHDFFYLTWF